MATRFQAFMTTASQATAEVCWTVSVPPSFVGEHLTNNVRPDGSPDDVVTVTCNDDGSGHVSWTIYGTAFGPYPGTFQETGSLTFGPFINTAGQSKVTSFQASFRVESPVGIVHGDKTLIPDSTVSPNDGYSCRTIASGAQVMSFQNEFAWDVTITTSDSVYAESGTGNAFGNRVLIQDTGAFGQNFTTSETGVVYVAPRTPTAAEQCKQGGYTQYAIFKNQGDCIAFVETLGKNEPGQNIPGQ